MTSKQKLQSLVHRLVTHSFTEGKLKSAKVSQITRSFTKLSSSQGLVYLKSYLQELKKYLQFRSLVIDCSSKLSQSQLATISKTFKKDYLVLETRENLDPSLLGGLRIKIGDAIFDYSLKARINELGKKIAR